MLALPRKQAGIGLVEIMVALVIGLVLMAGVFQIFQSNRTTYRVAEAMARVQENGRYAMMFLSRDLRMAGYSGCSRDLPFESTLKNQTNYEFDFNTHLTGHTDKNNNGNWSPGLPTALANQWPPLPGTDVITIRAAEGAATQIMPPYMNQTSAALHVKEGSGLNPGDIVVVSDCELATVFQITGGNPNQSGTITHNTGNAFSPGNYTEDLGKTYKGDAEVMRIATTTYFIRENLVGEPALWRRVGSQTPEELVSGVETMRIAYGIDNNMDSWVDEYKTADEISSWDDVVSVQLTLTVRSNEDHIAAEPQTVSYNGQNITDRRLRQTFTSTIGIRNKLR